MILQRPLRPETRSSPRRTRVIREPASSWRRKLFAAVSGGRASSCYHPDDLPYRPQGRRLPRFSSSYRCDWLYGSRWAALTLKAAADAAGKPIYLEMSSINPVFILPGALKERAREIAEEFQTSALMGTGQFCTNPGIVVLQEGEEAEQFIADMHGRFEKAKPTPLLGVSGLKSLAESVEALQSAGGTLVTGGSKADGSGCRFLNTLVKTTGEAFIRDPEKLQTEAFGNSNLFVVAKDADELEKVVSSFEGNLTGSIYTDTKGEDDGLYIRVERHLRRRVGRLLNDKMPTGVAVTPAMNHGGPYPATGHPGFTAVGIPGSVRRFAMLECYDNVREPRLPAELRDRNPGGVWRQIDGASADRWSVDAGGLRLVSLPGMVETPRL